MSSPQLWSAETICDAIRDFYAEYGYVPMSGHFGLGPPKHREKYRRVEWLPSHITVRAVFGSVGEAIEAAGLTRRDRGGPT